MWRENTQDLPKEQTNFMNLTVRPATTEDCPKLIEVFTEGATFHVQGQPDIFRPVAEPLHNAEFLSQVLANEDATIFVAEREGEIIGATRLQVRESQSLPHFVARRYIEVSELVVMPAARRLGVGQALMAAAEDWARSKRLAELELLVWGFNDAALNLYQKLGYITMARRMRKNL